MKHNLEGTNKHVTKRFDYGQSLHVFCCQTSLTIYIFRQRKRAERPVRVRLRSVQRYYRVLPLLSLA